MENGLRNIVLGVGCILVVIAKSINNIRIMEEEELQFVKDGRIIFPIL
jgi:chorismate-pyruvate lyase